MPCDQQKAWSEVAELPVPLHWPLDVTHGHPPGEMHEQPVGALLGALVGVLVGAEVGPLVGEGTTAPLLQ